MIRQRDLFDGVEAEALRERGMQLALDADRVDIWKAKAIEWLNGRPRCYRFTADELTRDIGLPDEGINRNNAVGALIASWARKGLIETTNYFKPSTRKARHGSVQRVWEKL